MLYTGMFHKALENFRRIRSLLQAPPYQEALDFVMAHCLYVSGQAPQTEEEKDMLALVELKWGKKEKRNED